MDRSLDSLRLLWFFDLNNSIRFDSGCSRRWFGSSIITCNYLSNWSLTTSLDRSLHLTSLITLVLLRKIQSILPLSLSLPTIESIDSNPSSRFNLTFLTSAFPINTPPSWCIINRTGPLITRIDRLNRFKIEIPGDSSSRADWRSTYLYIDTYLYRSRMTIDSVGYLLAVSLDLSSTSSDSKSIPWSKSTRLARRRVRSSENLNRVWMISIDDQSLGHMDDLIESEDHPIRIQDDHRGRPAFEGMWRGRRRRRDGGYVHFPSIEN